ncbi:exportin-7 isoform X1 [Balamuthia mandrillaris]
MNAQQLAQVEEYGERLYAATNPQQREEATRALEPFLEPSSIEILSKAQYVLDNSSSPYAQLLAAQCFTKIVNEHWNSLSKSMRQDLRNYLLSFLSGRGMDTTDFTLKSLIKLVCLITKLSWFDDTEHEKIVELISKFLQASLPHCIMGLRLFTQLVNEINQHSNKPKKGFYFLSLAQHRKVCISFRDTCLRTIFQIGLSTLQQLVSKSAVIEEAAQEEAVKNEALKLSLECLSFDFIGSLPDESSLDMATVQIPISWRSIIQDPATLRLFFTLYCSSQPPQSTEAMACLVQLVSVRRSVFSEDEDRNKYLAMFLQGTADILQHQTGLNHVSNHHELSRLLARLKANYQLNHIVSTEGYEQWVDLVAKFTVTTIKAWQWAPNSVYYLLNLWSRMVASIQYSKPEVRTQLDVYGPQILESYITSRLECASTMSGNDEDPLLDADALQAQLEALPPLGRCSYAKTSEFLVACFDPIAQSYEQNPKGPTNVEQVFILEGQLAWLVHIMGAMVAGRLGSANSDTHDTIDGELTARVFQLMQLHDRRLAQSGGDDSNVRLEWAFLSFLLNFRRIYIGEHSPSPLLYLRLAECLGINDNVRLMHFIITKIVTNLKFWREDSSVVYRTLKLFFDLAVGYSSGKLLSKMDIITEILTHHTSQYLPFLDHGDNVHNRTAFYSTLGRLLFSDTHIMKFEEFMLPFKQTTRSLMSVNSAEAFRQSDCKRVLIGLFRDLLGIMNAVTCSRSYTCMFEWIYPEHMPLLIQAAEVYYDTPSVTSPLLKFFSEFVNNRAERISFKPSSPHGILLFRETSKLLSAYGGRLLAYTPADPEDPYPDKYKGIWLCMQILANSLRGNYVVFGVFSLYGDPALTNALDAVLQLVFSIPFGELSAYPKMLREYYNLIHVLCLNHTDTIIELDTEVFARIVRSLYDGLTHANENVVKQGAAALNSILSFVVENKSKTASASSSASSPSPSAFASASPHVDVLKALNKFSVHNQAYPKLFPDVLLLLFQLIIYDEQVSIIEFSLPMLCLILLFPDQYNLIKNQLIEKQGQTDRLIEGMGGADSASSASAPSSSSSSSAASAGGVKDGRSSQQRLAEAFEKLMDGIGDNLLSKNREKFRQNLNAFRLEVRSFVA